MYIFLPNGWQKRAVLFIFFAVTRRQCRRIMYYKTFGGRRRCEGEERIGAVQRRRLGWDFWLPSAFRKKHWLLFSPPSLYYAVFSFVIDKKEGSASWKLSSFKARNCSAVCCGWFLESKRRSETKNCEPFGAVRSFAFLWFVTGKGTL